ncbi:hypothetical protein HBB16_04355 [Pseudonocardia sp. MCCB 268]|nr:hypothetical protein [Pseudonocardia cytotoxica]
MLRAIGRYCGGAALDTQQPAPPLQLGQPCGGAAALPSARGLQPLPGGACQLVWVFQSARR